MFTRSHNHTLIQTFAENGAVIWRVFYYAMLVASAEDLASAVNAARQHSKKLRHAEKVRRFSIMYGINTKPACNVQ